MRHPTNHENPSHSHPHWPTGLLLLSAISIGLPGCGDEGSADDEFSEASTDSEESAEESSESEESGDEGGNLPASFPMMGWVGANQAPGVDRPALVGASVCIRDTELCTTTDANGRFEFEAVPNGLHTWLEISAEEHLTGLMPFHTAHEGLNIEIGIWPRGALALLVASIGETIDDSAGHVLNNLFISQDEGDEDPPLLGYELTISPDSGVGPVFPSEEGLSLGGTATAGAWAWGNLPAGVDYTVSFSHPDYDCLPNLLDGPEASSTEFEFPSEAGTVVSFWNRYCVPKAGDASPPAKRVHSRGIGNWADSAR